MMARLALGMCLACRYGLQVGPLPAAGLIPEFRPESPRPWEGGVI